MNTIYLYIYIKIELSRVALESSRVELKHGSSQNILAQVTALLARVSPSQKLDINSTNVKSNQVKLSQNRVKIESNSGQKSSFLTRVKSSQIMYNEQKKHF